MIYIRKTSPFLSSCSTSWSSSASFLEPWALCSFSFFRNGTLDGISIDKNFVRNVHADKHSRKSVLDILALAKSLDLEVVGEGIESEEQNQFLRENGCHIVQGYLYARAMAREDALTLLRQSRN